MVRLRSVSYTHLVLYALSRVGSKASLGDLAAAAEKVGYKMEKTGANEAYIALIKRVLEQGDTKDAEKAANDLLKKSTKAGMTQTREAALQILLAAKPEAATKNLLSALKDTDKGYRNAALNFASGFADQNVYIEVMKHMLKAKPEVQVDILNWIGRESKCPSKHDMIKNLEPVSYTQLAGRFVGCLGLPDGFVSLAVGVDRTDLF